MSDKVVRKRLANGTIKEYRYARTPTVATARNKPGTIGALIQAYRESPEWRDLRPRSRDFKSFYLRLLEQRPAMPLTDFTRKEVIQARNILAAERGNATANCFVATASALFGWAVENDHMEINPVVRIRPLETGELRAWTAEEYDRIVPRLPEPLRRAAVLARYTGQRRSDLITMRWSQYDGRVIRLTQQKTGKSLVIPAALVLRDELEAWRSGQVVPLPNQTILTTARGKAWNADYLTRCMWEAVPEIDPNGAGLNVHGFRKLCAATLVELGCSEHEAAAITGHDDMSTLRVYTRSARQEKLAHAAVARLDNREGN